MKRNVIEPYIYIAILVLSTFFTCSLAAIYSGFSFDQPIAYLLIFFNWWDKVDLFFFFFQYIFSPLDGDSLYIFIFELLAGFFLTVSAIIQ